jgi:hypothetical protein
MAKKIEKQKLKSPKSYSYIAQPNECAEYHLFLMFCFFCIKTKEKRKINILHVGQRPTRAKIIEKQKLKSP